MRGRRQERCAPACQVPDFVLRVPFMRAFIGDTLAALAAPDWFRLYREAAAQP